MRPKENDFAAQYLGEFATLEIPLPDLLAMEYHIRCEDADKAISPLRDCFGEAVPRNPFEARAMQQSGQHVLSEMRREIRAQRLEVTEGELDVAIRRVGHSGMTVARMEQTLAARRERFMVEHGAEIALIEQICGLPLKAREP